MNDRDLSKSPAYRLFAAVFYSVLALMITAAAIAVAAFARAVMEAVTR